MKHLIDLPTLGRKGIIDIFNIADALEKGGYRSFLEGKCVAAFFPASSIRTRMSFEKGIFLLGGQCILFPSDTLDKKEELRDVAGYLGNWADAAVIRHKNISVIESFAQSSSFPVINAMTDINHPCEILSDLYALRALGRDIAADKYLFVGRKCNIGLAWKEAADVLGFELCQCCPPGYEMEGVKVYHSIEDAVIGKDIICTDSLPPDVLDDFRPFRITRRIMERTSSGALLDPCPPFYRGEEVSEDAIDSPFFVGYGFKKHLLRVQQAVIIYCMT